MYPIIHWSPELSVLCHVVGSEILVTLCFQCTFPCPHSFSSDPLHRSLLYQSFLHEVLDLVPAPNKYTYMHFSHAFTSLLISISAFTGLVRKDLHLIASLFFHFLLNPAFHKN